MPYGEITNLHYLENELSYSIMVRNLGLVEVVEYIWGTFALVALRVILGSFGALVIFLKIRFSKCCFFYT